MRSQTVVDDSDWQRLAQWRWSDSHGYAMRVVTRSGVRTAIWLHRLVVGLPSDDAREVDHIDGDTYNCRRSNLRIVTHRTNMENIRRPPRTSAHRGVCWNKARGAWVAQVFCRGKCHWLGYFATEEEAATVAREARQRLLPGAID